MLGDHIHGFSRIFLGNSILEAHKFEEKTMMTMQKMRQFYVYLLSTGKKYIL